MIFFLGFKGPPPHSKSKVVHHGRLKPNHRENIPNWLKPSSSWSFCVLSPIAQSPSLRNTKVFNESLIFCCWLSHVSMYHIKICYSTDFHEVLIKLTCFISNICLYQCGICTDFEFEKRFQCERHMMEQHSGFRYKCRHFKQVFNRTDNHRKKCASAAFREQKN